MHIQEGVSRPEGLFAPQFLFVLGGNGRLFADGATFELRRGCAFYLDMGVPHSYSGEKLITAWVTFSGDATDAVRRQACNRPLVIYNGVDTAKYQKMITDMEGEYFGKRREGILSAMMYNIAMSFFAEETLVAMSDMERVLSYMEEHFADDITLGELCAICGMGHSSFCEHFRARFGMTAFEMLMEIRLANADMMLKLYPEERVYVIAQDCGFSDVGYFCQAYKKKYGTSPRGK
jgi:AraC-like DNA-binding protein